MIKLTNVTKEYVKNQKVIDDLTLEINDGEIFGYLGPNGAGKTTTLKMITGITSITNGQIHIDDKDIYQDSYQAKCNLGFVPDNPDIMLRLKGIEYLHFLAKIYGLSKDEEKKRIEELADKFKLKEVLGNRIETYSHGMRQKISIMGVLMHQPNNLILDEPLTGLDPKSSFELKSIMKEYAKEGHTVIFSTHVLEVAEKLCDRVGIINKGKLIFVGTLKELKAANKTDKSLESIFLEMTDNEQNTRDNQDSL